MTTEDMRTFKSLGGALHTCTVMRPDLDGTPTPRNMFSASLYRFEGIGESYSDAVSKVYAKIGKERQMQERRMLSNIT